MKKNIFKTLGILTLALLIISTAGAASAYSSHGHNYMRGHYHNWNNFNDFSGHSCGNTCTDHSCGNTCTDHSCGNTCNDHSCGNTCNGNSCGNPCNGNRGGSSNNGATSKEESQKNSPDHNETQGTTSAVVEVTELEQINTALQKGPVLLINGAEWCEYCQQLKPVLNELATEYEGRATIMSIDIDQSPDLSDDFGVSSLPDSCVIVSIENGTYVYMQQNGKTTIDRSQARITGFNDKQVYEEVLNIALQE